MKSCSPGFMTTALLSSCTSALMITSLLPGAMGTGVPLSSLVGPFFRSLLSNG